MDSVRTSSGFSFSVRIYEASNKLITINSRCGFYNNWMGHQSPLLSAPILEKGPPEDRSSKCSKRLLKRHSLGGIFEKHLFVFPDDS